MKKYLKNKKGFTLLEVLVTTAIIGLLFVVATAIFINVIRSSNKANAINEAKENSALVMESLGRDVRQASSIVTPSPAAGINEIELTKSDGTYIWWRCRTDDSTGATATYSYITREVESSAIANPLNEFPVTNKDPNNGVFVNVYHYYTPAPTHPTDSCGIFSINNNNSVKSVELLLRFYQGRSSGVSQDNQILLTHFETFSIRGY